MDFRFLTALPVYNESESLLSVLQQVRRTSPEILVVDDGSTDETAELLRHAAGITVIRHATNRGYGAALRTAFCHAIRCGYPWVITIDCDGQHEPQQIPRFVDVCRRHDVDIVSGSRYLLRQAADSDAPRDRQQINQIITRELNERFGLDLTDAFCGFKAYRVESLRRLALTEDGYALPLQLWVAAARERLHIMEVPVPRIYLDTHRSFGGVLDDAETRLAYYRGIIDEAAKAEWELDSSFMLARCGGPAEE